MKNKIKKILKVSAFIFTAISIFLISASTSGVEKFYTNTNLIKLSSYNENLNYLNTIEGELDLDNELKETFTITSINNTEDDLVCSFDIVTTKNDINIDITSKGITNTYLLNNSISLNFTLKKGETSINTYFIESSQYLSATVYFTNLICE